MNISIGLARILLLEHLPDLYALQENALFELWRAGGLSAILLLLTGGTNAVWKTFTVDRNTLRTDHRFRT
jgi:hypothetical protein